LISRRTVAPAKSESKPSELSEPGRAGLAPMRLFQRAKPRNAIAYFRTTSLLTASLLTAANVFFICSLFAVCSRPARVARVFGLVVGVA
jgi:hypothetical protein